MYFKSQAGNSGERIERYSRAAGDRVRRQRFLQVRMLIHFSVLCLEAKSFGWIGVMGVLTVEVSTGKLGVAMSLSSGVGSSTVISGTGMVAFLPVGRS